MAIESEGSGAPPLAPPTRLVIDRSRWLRGECGNRSMLLRPSDGKMCCLGFLGLACGYSTDDIANEPEPNEMSGIYAGALPDLWPGSFMLDASPLIGINDSATMPESERESELTRLFAERGIAVTFVDGTEQPRAAPPERRSPMTHRRPYLVNVDRRICVPCRTNSHEKCEPIAVTEKGLAEGTAYIECACDPEWMRETHDSQRQP